MTYQKVKLLISVFFLIGYLLVYLAANKPLLDRSPFSGGYFLLFFGIRFLISFVQNRAARRKGEPIPYPCWFFMF